MTIKYNRVSTISQTGQRFTADTASYDLVLLDKISGSVSFHDRPKAKELVKLIEERKVTEITVEELSRLGRNTGNVLMVLEWLESKEINVIIRNLGLQSRPNGVKNPIWKMITSITSSLYEMELENIKERTSVGRMVYIQNGGLLGRPTKSIESEQTFLNKAKTIKIIKLLKLGFTIREISKLTDSSSKTVLKAKAIMTSNNLPIQGNSNRVHSSLLS